jgi:quercetin dioxygenase-like cupin family protein
VQTWDTRSLPVEPHHPQVLHSDGEGRTIVINLPAGEELQEHEVHEHAWLHVDRGAVELVVDGSTTQVNGGALAHWAPQQRRTVRAVEDALLLLLLAPWPGEGHPNLR